MKSCSCPTWCRDAPVAHRRVSSTHRGYGFGSLTAADSRRGLGMAGCSMGRAAGDGSEALAAVEPLLRGFPLRLTLVSPPRTGSTLLARILWEHPAVTHHCHEPFEAQYWGNAGPESCVKVFSNPLEIASATRSALDCIKGHGLLLKEMTFQINRSQFLFLARLASKPVVFVVQDPRLATTSRLRILKELRGAATFPHSRAGGHRWPVTWRPAGRNRFPTLLSILICCASNPSGRFSHWERISASISTARCCHGANARTCNSASRRSGLSWAKDARATTRSIEGYWGAPEFSRPIRSTGPWKSVRSHRPDSPIM